MGGDALDVLGVVEVVAVVLFVLGEGLTFGRHPLALEVRLLGDDAPEHLPDIGPLAVFLSDDMADPQHHIGHRRHLNIGVEKISGPFLDLGSQRIGGDNLPCERLQPPLAGHFRQRELARLEGEIEILQLLGCHSRLDFFGQLRAELPLPLDRPQHGLLPIGQLPGAADCFRN